MLPSILITLVTTAARMAVNNYVKADVAKEIINFAFDVVQRGSEAELKLSGILEELMRRKEEAIETGKPWTPDKSEIDRVWAEINARDEAWAKI